MYNLLVNQEGRCIFFFIKYDSFFGICMDSFMINGQTETFYVPLESHGMVLACF